MKNHKQCQECKKKFVASKIKKVPHSKKYVCPTCYIRMSNKNLIKNMNLNNDEFIYTKGKYSFNLNRDEFEFLNNKCFNSKIYTTI